MLRSVQKQVVDQWCALLWKGNTVSEPCEEEEYVGM